MALCNIIGTVYLPNGAVASSRQVTFRKRGGGIAAQYLGVVLPDDVAEFTNTDGSIDVDLLTGNYTVFVDRHSAAVAVPDADSATFASVIDAATIPDPVPAWYTDLLARIEALEQGGVVVPEIATITASTNITANTLITGAA